MLEVQRTGTRGFSPQGGRRARRDMQASGVQRARPCPIERNLFSVLFLAALHALGAEGGRLRFLGGINQCMRAWVTGCDNLLDDEYKSVLPFDLSGEGYRFRSVLMIMTADRVLCDILAEEAAVGGLSEQDARGLRHDTLRALVPSGLQEHDEETSICAILPPAELLEQVHVPKTGLLFEAPVRIARRLLPASEERLDSAQEGLRAFGLACQVLDDIVDFEGDVRAKRSNYVLSLAAAGGNGAGKTHAYADVDAATLDINDALRAACRKTGALFRESRTELAAAGLAISDAEWNWMLAAVPVLLRVPAEALAMLREGQ